MNKKNPDSKGVHAFKTDSFRSIKNINVFFFVVILFGLVGYLVRSGSAKISLGENFYRQGYTQTGTNLQGSGTLLVTPYGVEDQIFELLSEPTYDLMGRQYQITMREVILLLKNASYLGTNVKLLLEDKTYGDNTKNRLDFNDDIAGTDIQIKNDSQLGTNFIHAKTIILDEKAIISTANLGYPGFWKNREYWFIVDQKDIVENLKILFEMDRSGKSIRPDQIHPSLLFCPIDCREKLSDLIDSAQSSLDMQLQYLEDPQTIDQIKEKITAGIDVRILVSDNQQIDSVRGLSGVRIMKSPYIHSKNLLVDGEQLLIGSMNFSTNAIENNREIGIVTRMVPAIKTFQKQFDKDRGQGFEIEF